MNNTADLTKYLTEFKEYTIALINCIENEQYDLLEDNLLLREQIIKKINLLKYTKEQFSSICIQLQIVELNKKLSDLMNMKRSKLRAEMESMASTRSAHKSYTKLASVDSLYFNKKI